MILCGTLSRLLTEIHSFLLFSNLAALHARLFLLRRFGGGAPGGQFAFSGAGGGFSAGTDDSGAGKSTRKPIRKAIKPVRR